MCQRLSGCLKYWSIDRAAHETHERSKEEQLNHRRNFVQRYFFDLHLKHRIGGHCDTSMQFRYVYESRSTEKVNFFTPPFSSVVDDDDENGSVILSFSFMQSDEDIRQQSRFPSPPSCATFRPPFGALMIPLRAGCHHLTAKERKEVFGGGDVSCSRIFCSYRCDKNSTDRQCDSDP